jgi:Phage integrase, N-terminal SAM-like domain
MGLINDYLGYLADRGYSPQTVRAYAFDLLAFARWLAAERLALGEVSADVVLRYLAYCRRALLPGRAGGNVYSIRDGATSAMRLRRSTVGWPLCQAYSATRRCGTRLRPAPSRVAPRHAGHLPGSAAGCWPTWPGRNGALACGSASRGGCPAAWTARARRAAGELPHRLEKVCPTTDLPTNESAWSPVSEHSVSMPSCPDYRNNIPNQPQNSHCRRRKAHIGVPWRTGCLVQIR